MVQAEDHDRAEPRRETTETPAAEGAEEVTDKQYDRDENGKLIKKIGWHSWRHNTREAQDEARERYLATHATARARLARKERLRAKRQARKKTVA